MTIGDAAHRAVNEQQETLNLALDRARLDEIEQGNYPFTVEIGLRGAL